METINELKKQLSDLYYKRVMHKVTVDNHKYLTQCLKQETKKLSLQKKELTIKYLEACGSNIRCPLCGAQMKKINFRKNIFYGCVNYPVCKGTLSKYKLI